MFQQAEEEQFDALEIVLGRHAEQVVPMWYGILFMIPETADPKEFNFLLPKQTRSTNDGPKVLRLPKPDLGSNSKRSVDWAESPALSEILQANKSGSGSSDAANDVPASAGAQQLERELEQMGYERVLVYDPAVLPDLGRWIEARAEAVEACGLVGWCQHSLSFPQRIQ